MLAEPQWAQIFSAARQAGASWPDMEAVDAFKREVQAALADQQFYTSTVVHRETPVHVTQPTVDLAKFFATMRAGRVLGPTLSPDEVSGCEAIIAACKGWPAPWIAYALATAYHETSGTMQPIKEYGGTAYFRRMYDIEGNRPAKARELGNLSPGDGARYAGRGYVQLTGRANYAKAQDKLGAPFVAQPDLAMQPEHAAAIMARGMTERWFTGKGLADYLPTTGKATHAQFQSARRIINGTDMAAAIATYALEFQRALA